MRTLFLFGSTRFASCLLEGLFVDRSCDPECEEGSGGQVDEQDDCLRGAGRPGREVEEDAQPPSPPQGENHVPRRVVAADAGDDADHDDHREEQHRGKHRPEERTVDDSYQESACFGVGREDGDRRSYG